MDIRLIYSFEFSLIMSKTMAIQQEKLLYSDETTEKAMLMASKLYGSVKRFKRKPLTKKERDQLALSLTPEEGARLFKKFGL